MVKVGGVNEKLISRKYKLTLIDKKGQELQIDVYGIDKITSDIQAINLGGIHRLFRNVTKEEIPRPTGEVDVLNGFEYAGFHPQTEQSSEHLLLLKNRFGKCTGGTHPQIKETSERHELNSVQVLHSTSSTILLQYRKYTSTISKILGLNAARDAKDVNAENVPWEVRTIRLKKRKNLL